MIDYSEMSDFEINKKVATLWLPCDYYFNENTVDLVNYGTYLGPHGVPDERLEKYGEFDPCNNASDAWMIIVENGISLVKENHEEWYCCNELDLNSGFDVDNLKYDKNPLRAAMIVFLMMKDKDHDRKK